MDLMRTILRCGHLTRSRYWVLTAVALLLRSPDAPSVFAFVYAAPSSLLLSSVFSSLACLLNMSSLSAFSSSLFPHRGRSPPLLLTFGDRIRLASRVAFHCGGVLNFSTGGLARPLVGTFPPPCVAQVVARRRSLE